MANILIINNTKFPECFLDVEIDTFKDNNKKIKHIEEHIIKSINKYNNKLNIDHIEYNKLSNIFPNVIDNSHDGVIVSKELMEMSKKNHYENKSNYFCIDHGKDSFYLYSILEYVILSSPTIRSRTSFVSQTLFPTLIDYMDMYYNSPSFTIANHNFMFINYVKTNSITAKMALRHLTGIILMKMDYIDVFDDYIDKGCINLNPKEYLEQYDSDFNGRYNPKTNIYENDNYTFDFNKKLFKLKNDSLCNNTITTDNKCDFHGSSEKFYWIEILPMTIFAFNKGYKVDLDAFDEYINEYGPRFSENSTKIKRCEILLKYLKKYTKH